MAEDEMVGWREFSRAAVPVWGFHEVGRGAQGASRVAPGKLGNSLTRE